MDFESHIHKRKDSLVKVPLFKKTYTLSPISSHFLSISSNRTNLLPRDKSIICSPLQSAAHHLPFSSPPGGPSVPSAAAAPISRDASVSWKNGILRMESCGWGWDGGGWTQIYMQDQEVRLMIIDTQCQYIWLHCYLQFLNTCIIIRPIKKVNSLSIDLSNDQTNCHNLLDFVFCI